MRRLPRRSGEVGTALVAVLVARTAVNGGMRVVYPFLPEIARGLGISLAVAGALVALRSFAGVAAPLLPRVVERVGRRALMLTGVAATLAGCLVVAGAGLLSPPVGASPGPSATAPVVLAATGFVLLGVAKPVFDVPMQAWFGERVPYQRRGRVLGATELTWALSLLVTVPASGFLIAATGWTSPFLLVAVLCVAGAVAVVRLIPGDRPRERLRRPLRLTGPRTRILGVVVLFTLASELLFVVYGRWLEDDFGLTVTAIGLFTLVVVAAELAGEGAVSAFADRVGLRRSIVLGLLGSAMAYAGLGAVGGSLVAAVVAVAAWLAMFELTIVSTIPFVSELAAESRDRLLSLMVATVAGGRAVGALLAEPTYRLGGMAGSGLAAAVCVLVAAALLLTVPSPVRAPTRG